MCTVTISPIDNNGFVLTSNRDEAPNRKSLSPEFYDVEGVKTLFPKDELSGGTWIGVSEKNRLVCVLNGGFIIHERKAEYRKSRGIVAKDFMVADDVFSFIKTYDLEDVEPFTIVIADWNIQLKFIELVWDGNKKHIAELPLESKLWSSSTLYDEEMKIERQQWFKDFKAENDLTPQSLMAFHKEGAGKNLDYGVLMDRGFVKTTSITQVEKQGGNLIMSYENLQDGTVTNKIFRLPQIVNE
ncbi:NRDE family protein [Seonamhaeicola sp. ML3]|uniref:NRDE family protein n=1 Tax=Seonamhaeicola sp. ML3 TaxID=2937786 RepID=UPI00200DB107|nr:NRDE family protein [Seonamhaeicola sp. ML3]